VKLSLLFPTDTHEAGVETDFSSIQLKDICLPTPFCDPISLYRTIDGSCNNLQNPKFGQAFTSLNRILPNAYADGELVKFLTFYRVSTRGL